ncbi:MAG: hypothetical protein ACI9UK_000305 [Candidatus Krumholzibacteriia bacterium]|jgi:hypothetical protein
MAKAAPKLKFKRTRKTILWSAGACVWLGVLVGVAIPAWRQAMNQHRQVKELESQLADLDSWTVAGMWIEKSLGPRQEVINPQWDRLFPSEESKGELFLTLARVADQSKVENFELKEIVDIGNANPSDDLYDDGLDNAEYSGTMMDVPLDSYRVQARFQGQYAEVAKFLGGLKTINRAVSVHNLAIQPVLGAVHVDLELDVYVSASNES